MKSVVLFKLVVETEIEFDPDIYEGENLSFEELVKMEHQAYESVPEMLIRPDSKVTIMSEVKEG